MRRIISAFTCVALLAFGSFVMADNQQLADSVEQALVQRGNLQDSDQIQVSVKNGIVTLEGSTNSNNQRVQIEQVVKSVNGVQAVNNKMTVVNNDITQVSMSMVAAPTSPAVGQQAGGISILSDVPVNQAQPTPAGTPASAGTPNQAMVPDGTPIQYGTPLPMNSTPQYTMPDANGQRHAVRYDRPYLPRCAWPSYAAYPNSAAVCYPKRYAANAWPYIGPVYPYPQVPLGWRDVTLKWHDGTWRMEFNDGTYHGTTESVFRPFKSTR